MNILYIGDIMGAPGRNVVKKILPQLKEDHGIDLVIAQGENLSGGKGLSIKSVEEMRSAGVDVFTGGNHTWHNEEIFPLLNDPSQHIIRPANYPEGAPGRGWTLVPTPFGNVLVISLLGHIVPATPDVANPLRTVDNILREHQNTPLAATVVNFHGDYSSEKLVIGHYLDGRVTAVIGDHWHIPTADARVLPHGTAHITDVGMVGSRDSSLGVKSEIIIKRWLSQLPSRNELETNGQMQFCGLIIRTGSAKNTVKSVEQFIKFVDN